jgi:hypothetical protein
VTSLLALAGAFVALVGDQRTLAAALGGAGAVGLVVAVLLASASTERIRYRPRRMAGADWVVAVVVVLAPVALAVCSIAGDGSLTWFASEPLGWPPLHAAPGVALLPLLVPLVARRGSAR